MTSKKVYTNVTASPVVLSNGTSVGPGEQTTEEQYELAKGSFWEEHGVLVSGEPKLSDDGSRQIDDLRAENDKLREDLFNEQAKSQKLEADAKDMPAELEKVRKSLIDEQARSQKLEADLKAALAKK